MTPRSCPTCTSPIGAQARFCRSCGATVADLPPLPTDGTTPVPGKQKARAAVDGGIPHTPDDPPGRGTDTNDSSGTGRRRVVVAAVVGVLALVSGIGLAAVLLQDRGSGGEATTRGSNGSVQEGPPTPGDASVLVTTGSTSTTTTSTPRPTTSEPLATLEATALTLSLILEQSAVDRDEIVEVVTTLGTCTIAPEEAYQRTRSVIESRESLRSATQALRVGTVAEGQRLVNELVEAFDHSIDSNESYLAWIDGTYRTEYRGVRCPDGPPQDSFFQAGVAASGRASEAKQQFASSYNQAAERFGLRTWTYLDF
jgi:hypothetical protein